MDLGRPEPIDAEKASSQHARGLFSICIVGKSNASRILVFTSSLFDCRKRPACGSIAGMPHGGS
jgi:hypothetical protein